MATSSIALRQQRCANHPQREASARCPQCSHFYCRECITEHDDRVLCASCLAKLAGKKEDSAPSLVLAYRLLLALLALGVIYLVFFLIGNLLLAIPSQFHKVGGW